jgi:undecaprenyl-diphosphatase
VTTIQAAILGAVQGVTEFLPVSSTAHLRIVPALLGWADPGAAFTAVLQLGTLAAVIVFFARDLTAMIRETIKAVSDPARRGEREVQMLLYLIVGTLPVVVAGVLLKKHVEGSLRSLSIIAGAMIAVALVLAYVEKTAKHVKTFDQIALRDALIIGAAQALALVPGVSRSGITLLAAMAIGLRRDAAARFSFLLSIPAVAGAGIFELKHVLHAQDGGAPLLVGLVVAAISGYASIAWLLQFLRTRTTAPFIVYRILAGAAIFALLATGHLAG